ncbi:MAG: DUF2235 domain-containing protein [Pseudomonadota bacterium]
MGKNIVILCDGTSNEISKDRTNVLRLYGCLEKSDAQSVFYDPGVGTFGAENSASYYYRRGVEIWGLATGWGLDANVKEAYRHLVHSYNPGSGKGKRGQADRIFLFGFSRGAYTARVLSGFIHAFGLMRPENLNLLDYAYRAYKGVGSAKAAKREGGAFAELRLFERILRPERPQIRLLGLFDTVGSVIESGRYGPRLRTHAHTSRNKSVQSVRHAVALDEHRTMFQPQLWPSGGVFRQDRFDRGSEIPQDVEEVWFAGSHGDVGGGSPEPKSGLAKITLEWMINEAKGTELKFDDTAIEKLVLGKDPDRPVGPNPHAPVNASMTPGWAVLECLPRIKRPHIPTRRRVVAGLYVPRFEERIVPDGAKVHGSVFEHDDGPNPTMRGNIPIDHIKV